MTDDGQPLADASVAHAAFALAELARIDGDAHAAAQLHGEALELYRRIADAPREVACLEAIAGLAAAAGRCQRAAVLLGAAHASREVNGYARAASDAARYDAILVLVHDDLGAGIETAWGHGASLSLGEGVDLALKLLRTSAVS